MEAVGALMAPDAGETVPRDLKRLEDAMAPFRAAGGYFNFIDSPCDVDSILPAETCSRLADVKRKWDPDGTIVANHAVALGEAPPSTQRLPPRQAGFASRIAAQPLR